MSTNGTGNIQTKYYRLRYDWATELIKALGMLNGAQAARIGNCPNFESSLDPKSILSARGYAWVEAYAIPVELVEEIIKICYSEWPKRS